MEGFKGWGNWKKRKHAFTLVLLIKKLAKLLVDKYHGHRE